MANLWMKAPDRPNVADAANQIDSMLRLSPYAHSESREANLRILFVPPLATLFDVSDADRMVTVRAVWRPE